MPPFGLKKPSPNVSPSQRAPLLGNAVSAAYWYSTMAHDVFGFSFAAAAHRPAQSFSSVKSAHGFPQRPLVQPRPTPPGLWFVAARARSVTGAGTAPSRVRARPRALTRLRARAWLVIHVHAGVATGAGAGICAAWSSGTGAGRRWPAGTTSCQGKVKYWSVGGTVRSNHSLEARPNIKTPGPRSGASYYPLRGPGVLLSVPPQLER